MKPSVASRVRSHRFAALCLRLLLALFTRGLLWAAGDGPAASVVPTNAPPGPTLSPARRLEKSQLQATHDTVQRFARERIQWPELGALEDIRAVLHVHAQDADHTKGNREQVLAGAKKARVRAVFLTDHRGPRPETWHGVRDGVLFVAGSEDGDGKLRFPEFGPDHAPLAEGALKFITHIEERYDASPAGFTGMEIVNRHTDAILDRTLEQLLAEAAKDPAVWQELLEKAKAWPDEVFAAGCDYHPAILAKWDRELAGAQPFMGIGANDAHQNVILNGHTFDPYEVSFRNLSTHLLATNLSEAALRAALREGHGYVSHDWLCDPTSFAFGAVNNLGVFTMGDTVPMQGTTRLVALTPLPATLRLFRDGALLTTTNGTNLTFRAKKPGVYRLEAWLDVAGEPRPWIYANPVRLKETSLLDTPLPDMSTSPAVEVRKDLTYTEGRPEDAAKHKLDVYIPKERKLSPVFLFLHGGAWRSGDRGLYPPLGQRFARDGILTVIPSYRLAPKIPWPAQAEDSAAALAWTVNHIGELGGDTNRIFLGGHSAGGHLSALLVFNRRYLEPHGINPELLAGVVALSGVYNLDIGDIESSVFGKERGLRQNASPLLYVRAPAPAFFVSYCEWDYATLPSQAKVFHAALRENGVASELFYTPKESHISEVIAMTHDEDPTGRAISRFILGPAR